MKVRYFGCWNSYLGHYLREPNGAMLGTSEIPWGDQLDGCLQPQGRQLQGDALLHHKGGWTALAFWDRSMDTRPGSCSVFLAEGTHSFERMAEISKEQFPQIWNRFEFEVKLVEAVKS